MQSIPDKGGVPRLSRDDIESKAEEVLGAISPAALRFPQLTPLTDLIIKFSSEYQTKFIFDLDLGMSKSGKRILGKFVTNPREIYIDKSLEQGSPRWRFTLAHELGHLVLHRKVTLNEAMSLELHSIFVDTVFEVLKEGRRPSSSHEWLEWQANTFAACLLMPAIP